VRIPILPIIFSRPDKKPQSIKIGAFIFIGHRKVIFEVVLCSSQILKIVIFSQIND
jgi:hypothetical protein